MLSAPFPSLVVEIGDVSPPGAHQATLIVGGGPGATVTDMIVMPPPPPLGQPVSAPVEKVI